MAKVVFSSLNTLRPEQFHGSPALTVIITTWVTVLLSIPLEIWQLLDNILQPVLIFTINLELHLLDLLLQVVDMLHLLRSILLQVHFLGLLDWMARWMIMQEVLLLILPVI